MTFIVELRTVANLSAVLVIRLRYTWSSGYKVKHNACRRQITIYVMLKSSIDQYWNHSSCKWFHTADLNELRVVATPEEEKFFPIVALELNNHYGSIKRPSVVVESSLNGLLRS